MVVDEVMQTGKARDMRGLDGGGVARVGVKWVVMMMKGIWCTRCCL